MRWQMFRSMARSKKTASQAMRKLLRDRRLANRGDVRAQRRFDSTVEQWTNRANKMLERLEKQGKTRMAYKSAMAFIKPAYGEDATRFSTNLHTSRAKYKQALAINHFLTLKTSTLAGQKEVERKRVAAFRETMSDSRYSGIVKEMSKKEILDFFDFMDDHPLGQFIAEQGRFQSGDEMDTFMEAIFKFKRPTDEIDKALAAYKQTETWNETHPGKPMPQSMRFYHDKLIQYLKGGIDVKFNDQWEYITKKPNEEWDEDQLKWLNRSR